MSQGEAYSLRGRGPEQVLADLEALSLRPDELLFVSTFARGRLTFGEPGERRLAWARVALAAIERFPFHSDPNRDGLQRATEKCHIHLTVSRMCPEDPEAALGLPVTIPGIALRELPDDLSEVERVCVRWRQDPRATVDAYGIEQVAVLRSYKNLLSAVLVS
ncbi:hypothetical protein [Nocardiopsis suaedae]|uniref:Uncharacterized protein n=1 Tax=Nocardiopsis suaedae TaxID=3018444 RepID=A0ABT4TV11_9ACTN|nr:hypothetical protein [Nocardiopsis suaedae]MDA2808541.1 hypothetical protein [Nocardiopsis suaedae]